MKTVAIVQARMGSTRFPKKVMEPIFGTPMIGLLVERLAKASRIDEIVVATTHLPSDDALAAYVESLGISVYRGSESDVLDRYFEAARQTKADFVVRITGDCPLIDPELVDAVIDRIVSSGADYASNIAPPTYPDGLDTEVFTFAALDAAWRCAALAAQREHVTPYIRESDQFRKANVQNDRDVSFLRWTVDEPEDLDVVKGVVAHFQPFRDFSWRAVLELYESKPQLFEANRHFMRNEGQSEGSGQKLWKRAKKVIPGGSMLLSKRAEMFLPDKWPAYFSKSKGCAVWDLDGREYVDMSLMGIGTNTLGYGHPEVDRAVLETVAAGNMSTLNCPEEVLLAERLVEMHPWADMVRLARSGGEANSIAIRIARAASGRDKVAVCGYHGWHDWYLAANLGNDESLAGHLLPGLEPKGVPANLRGSVLPFNYNDLEGLESLFKEHKIGVIKMEVSRNSGPAPGFLERVREMATAKGAILIFDECTSGFRQTFGGLHKLYGVEPDLAIFGKALGNGYAITAVIGRRDIMEAAQSTFISSTFWTERIGPSAALKTLEVMERENSWEQITDNGQYINDQWRRIAALHGLSIQISGLPALTSFSFPHRDMLKYKTFITQEMLKRGYLASTAVYVCTAHSRSIIDRYLAELEPNFRAIKDFVNGGDIDSALDGPVCHAGFKRLN